MLGSEISKRTASLVLRKLPRPPGRTWKMFLQESRRRRFLFRLPSRIADPLLPGGRVLTAEMAGFKLVQ